MSLAAILSGLRDASSEHTYTAAPIRGQRGVLLGVDREGHPALFFPTEEARGDPPLRTRTVSLHIGQRYRLTDIDGTPRDELLHALVCEASEADDVGTFLILAEALLAGYDGRGFDEGTLTSFFRSMVRLFSVTPARDTQSARLGLWGELFVMSRVRGFRFWGPHWHSEGTRRFDFSCGRNRIEVKTTIGSERVHHFSHRQLVAAEGEQIRIASIVTSEDDSGLSLRELVRACRRSLLGRSDVLKLEKAVRYAGMNHACEAGPVLDSAEAAASLAWFRAEDAPHFPMPEPAGVSGARYRVDLATAPQVAVDELRDWLMEWDPEPVVTTEGH